MLKNRFIGLKTYFLNLHKNRNLVKKAFRNIQYEELFQTHKVHLEEIINSNEKRHLLKYKPDEIWMNNLILKIGLSIKLSHPNLLHGYILYSKLREFYESKGQRDYLIVETGTAKGFSTFIMARASLDHNVKFQIYTFDTLNLRVKRFWNAYNDELGLRNFEELASEFKDLYKNISFINKKSIKMKKHLPNQRVDFAFLDSSHSFKTVLKEMMIMSNLQRNGDVIFLDDLNDSKYPGIRKAIVEMESRNIYTFEYLQGLDGRNYAIGIRKEKLDANKTINIQTKN